MILEQQTMEQAELYALGLLDSSEAAEFERTLLYDEDLQQYLTGLEDSVAALALTAPQMAPPRRTFDTIQDRIQTSSSPRTFFKEPKSKSLLWTAAAIILLSGVSVFQFSHNIQARSEIENLRASLRELTPSSVASAKSREGHRASERGDTSPSGTASSGPRASSSLISESARARDQYISQKIGELREEISRLERERPEEFITHSGAIARMTVVEMLDPSMDETSKEERRMILPSEVSEILASGLSPETEPEPENQEEVNTVTLSGTDNSWEGQIVIESGLVNLDLVNLPKGETIRHKNFPLDEIESYRGIEPLPDGKFYDTYSDILWQPGLNGEYIGFRPNEEPEISVPETPVQEPEPVAEATPENTTGARAITLYDETTGMGSIIVSRVEAPPEGKVYQLWANLPEQEEPINLGLVPSLENGGGRIGFELPEPGSAPRNYRLTAEPLGGSSSPTGPVILSGP